MISPVVDVDEHLGERRLVGERPPEGRAGVVAPSDHEVQAGLVRLLLGETDRCHLRVAEHRSRHRLVVDGSADRRDGRCSRTPPMPRGWRRA